MAIVGNWVWQYNLPALLREIAAMAGEELDEGVRQLFLDDIKASDTDASPERWASCDFDGSHPIKLRAGIDQGTEVLRVMVELPEALVPRCNTVLELMNTYRVLLRS